MEIIGNGFLARNLRHIATRHPGTIALAAGISVANDNSPDAYDREATLLQQTILRCIAEGKQLLFFSSTATGLHSEEGGRSGEDGAMFPVTPYGRHKLALESAIASSGADHLILRLSHVVGSDQRRHLLLPALVDQLRSGRVRLYRNVRRDIIDIDDVIQIIDALLTEGVRRQIVNVASGHAVLIETIVDHLQRLLGTDAVRVPVDMPSITAQPVSIAKLRRLLPMVDDLGFDADYFRATLDKHAPSYAAQPRNS